MSFWDLSDGSSAADVGDEYELPGGGFSEPIPDDSNVLAMIEEARWTQQGDFGPKYINFRWTVLAPDEYKGRKVNQKLWIDEFDPEALKKGEQKAEAKRDNNRRLFAAIDTIAGQKLFRAKTNPTDESMTMALTNVPMIIKVGVWSMPDRNEPGRDISGNWVKAAAPRSKGVDVKPAKPKPEPKPRASSIDDDIPF